jgi:hypothetical protein
MSSKLVLLAAMAGVGMAALSVGAQRQGGADDKATRPHQHATTAQDKCAAACSDCQRACDACAHHCGMMLAEGKKEHLTTLQTCQDCATVCAAAACIVARHGPFSDSICKACAEACNRCGKECDKFPNDPMMKKCADACKACEKACRDMLDAHHPGEQAK